VQLELDQMVVEAVERAHRGEEHQRDTRSGDQADEATPRNNLRRPAASRNAKRQHRRENQRPPPRPRRARRRLFTFLALKCFALHPTAPTRASTSTSPIASPTAGGSTASCSSPPAAAPALAHLLHRAVRLLVLLLKALPSLAGAAQGVLLYFVARKAFASELAGW